MRSRILLSLLLLVAVITLVFGYFLFTPKSLRLLSPFLGLGYPDVTAEISKTLTLLPELDYTRSTASASLHPRLRYLVFNPRTQKVYAAKGEKDIISPASFTKLLTVQVGLDLAGPQTPIQTTATSIDKVPTVLGLKLGETLSLSDLLRASIATSGNDAAATLAEGVAAQYSQKLPFFVDAMNQKAEMLKMYHSRFATPDGLDAVDQYSTLADIARLVYNATSYPEIVAAGAADMQDIATSSAHGYYYLPNWNGLLGVYPGVDGLKIAYTETAGYSTIVTARRQDIPVIVLLTGADSIRERDLAAASLLDLAYLTHRLPPVNLTRTRLDRRYKQWADLATKIRAELKELEKQSQK